MSKMNSQERVFTALQGKIPDRVPLMEMFIDPKVIHSICPGMSYEDFIDYAEMDGVTCLTIAEEAENIDWIDEQEHIWRDKWGARQTLTEEVLSVITPPARIETERDLENYEPPDPNTASVLKSAKKLVERFKGKKAIAVIGEAVFAPSQYLRAGLANLMMDYVEQPELVTKLAKVGIDYHVELYRKLIAEGVEVVILGDDYAGKTGTFMSPTHFEKFILPGFKTIVREIKQAGGYVIKHCDGDIWSIIDMLTSTDLDMLGPLEAPYMNLAKVRKHTKGKVGVMGNIDVDLLSRGSTEQIKKSTEQLLREMNGIGGHILSSGNSISSSVTGENFMTMLTTAKEMGR